jgi:hypothetical protein
MVVGTISKWHKISGFPSGNLDIAKIKVMLFCELKTPTYGF